MNRLAAHLCAGAIVLFGALTVVAGAAPDRSFTQDSFARIRANHAGKPLVVHVWGMTCGPCLAELPQWGALRRKRPDMRLVLIQVDPAPARARAQTLGGAGLAKVESWHVEADFDEFLRASIDPSWPGDMPRTLLIAPNGEVTTLRGVADLALVGRWLDAHSTRR